MNASATRTRNVVLVGGGHAHALVLRSWRSAPTIGARLTVINPSPTAPYTGMLPGFVAGHYSRDELDYDLAQLARSAGAELVLGSATTIDRSARTITVDTGSRLPYDVCSINVGASSAMNELDGFTQHAVPAKPLGSLAGRWTDFVHGWSSRPDQPSVAVIGGGLAGCELAMAMSFRLRHEGHDPLVSVIDRSTILEEVGATARRKLRNEIAALGVEVREHTSVEKVTRNHLELNRGGKAQRLRTDFVLGAAGARALPWISQLGLATTNGFLDVDNTLQTTTDPKVFAVGDCAHLTFDPRPKAGVFAVREAPYLLKNIKALLQGTELETFDPQSDYLKLVSLGKKSAGADKFGRFVKGSGVWWLKARIDRTFMAKLG